MTAAADYLPHFRFDPVYVGHFKRNKRRIADYPNLWSYTRELYETPGIRETIDFGHIKGQYYQSHRIINPTGIVPLGPITPDRSLRP